MAEKPAQKDREEYERGQRALRVLFSKASGRDELVMNSLNVLDEILSNHPGHPRPTKAGD